MVDITPLVKNWAEETAKTKKGTTYLNVASAFDIETSSFLDQNTGEKRAIMYMWGYGLNNEVIIGRTWEEFLTTINSLIKEYNLSLRRRIIIYVHNLSYEFQFFRKLFKWETVFAIDDRKVLYALTKDGIEFRCSYLLSGYSLKKVGENLKHHKAEKMVGDLDYKKIRNHLTKMTKKEIGYQYWDIKVLLCYIQEEIERNGDITKIPLTKTGYVRRFCRNNCHKGFEKGNKANDTYKKYRKLMKELVLSEIDYIQLKRAFTGGYTHANALNSCKVFYNVTSMDFTSSYPFVMVSEKFPMSTAEEIVIKSNEEFERNLKSYCCIFDAEFTNIEQVNWTDSYISASKCDALEKPILNNGRVVKADRLTITITEQDFLIIKHIYKWDNLNIKNFNRYKKAYLPKNLILSILSLYRDKTELKGVKGKEEEYLNGKEMLNATFGMMVTDIVRDEHIYTDTDLWGKEKPDTFKSIQNYNKNGNRFLYYPWGVWTTAYARRNLWSGILELGSDYIYSDTDSVKFINYEKHKNYFDNYNNLAVKKLRKMCEELGVDFNLTRPKTIKGEEKQLGIWDFDGHYTRFKTLGAKRYMVEHDNGEINITVSGVNKYTAVPYLINTYGKNDVFNAFNNGLYIPKGYAGKNIMTYIDEETIGILTDYQGNETVYHEGSSVHMEEGDYTLQIGKEYIDYMKGVRYRK